MNKEFAREKHLEDFINDLIHMSVKYDNSEITKIRDLYIGAHPNYKRFERILKSKIEDYNTGLADIPIGTALYFKYIENNTVNTVTSDGEHMSIKLDLLIKHFTYADNTRLDKDGKLPERVIIIGKKGDIDYTIIKEY